MSEYYKGKKINGELICGVSDQGNYNPIITTVSKSEDENLRNTYVLKEDILEFVKADPLTDKQARNYINKSKR